MSLPVSGLAYQRKVCSVIDIAETFEIVIYILKMSRDLGHGETRPLFARFRKQIFDS